MATKAEATVLDDIATIEAQQVIFKALHGEYFEIKFNPKEPVPVIGDVKNTTYLDRFISVDAPVPTEKTIPFVPVSKDYQFIVGRAILRAKDRTIAKEKYMITARRKRLDGTIETLTFEGGDVEALKNV